MEDPQRGSPTNIMDLPEECLVLIFQCLTCAGDREAFGLTCLKWLEIQNQYRQSLQFGCSLNLFEVPLTRTPYKIGAYELYRLLERFKHLQSLSLSGCTQLRDSGLNPLRHYGPTLQNLNLDCCFEITDSGLSVVASGCPSLTFISLYRCNITDGGLETLAKCCLALEDVNLSYCSSITDQGVRFIVQNCLQLCAIKTTNCRGISGVGFRGCSQTLAYLEAESCYLKPEGISSIVSGGGLEYLNISHLNWSVNVDGFAAIGAGLGTRLRVLNMRLCRTLGDESVLAIAKGCPSLVEWNLALCHEVRLAGWESIALNCHNLESLHVNRCRNLCDRGLRALRDGCKRLCVLYMNRCPQISELMLDVFRFSRRIAIREEEQLAIGPTWASRW